MSIKCLFGFHSWRKATVCRVGEGKSQLLADVIVCPKCGRTEVGIDFAKKQSLHLRSNLL